MAGSPGAGKSTLLRVLAGGLGYSFIDSDHILSHLMKKSGLSLKMPDHEAEARHAVRSRAFDLLQAKQTLQIAGGHGLLIDTTAADLGFVRELRQSLMDQGYACRIVFVSVPLEVALRRNASRERSLPDHVVEQRHRLAESNKEALLALFGRDAYDEIDNGAEGVPESRADVLKVAKKIRVWTERIARANR